MDIKANVSDDDNYTSIGGQNVRVVTTGDGLYGAEGKYVYKGADPNNYIEFNGSLWRILSKESDEKLELIDLSSDMSENYSFDSNERTTGYCTSYCNAWGVNNSYVNGNLSGIVESNSYLNNILNDDTVPTTFYSQNLNSTAKGLIKQYEYNVGPINNDNLSCIINDEKSIKWNGKIAIISVSDYLLASNNDSCNTINTNNQNIGECKGFNWLYTGLAYYTLTPEFNNNQNLYYITADGTIETTSANTELKIYPVVHLNDVTLTGSGTENDPYKIGG